MERRYLSYVVLGVFCSLEAADVCPNGLECPKRCCTASDVSQGPKYFCCQEDLEHIYIIGLSNWWKDNSGIFIGCLIASIIISILISLACCFFCNGCWWFKRRHNDHAVMGGSCLNTFPFGTIIYSPYPPNINDYQGSTSNGTASRPRVHFEDDVSASFDSYDRLKPAIKTKQPSPA